MSAEDDWEDPDLYDVDPEDWEIEHPSRPKITTVTKSDDEDLEAYWADVQGPAKMRVTSVAMPCHVDVIDVPPRGATRSSVSFDLLIESSRQTTEQDQPTQSNVVIDRLLANGHLPIGVPIEVGLFTENGEVTGAGYVRMPSRMRVDERGAHLGSIIFPTALADWGTIQTAAVFVGEEEPLFYLDMTGPTRIRARDTLTLVNITARIERSV